MTRYNAEIYAMLNPTINLQLRDVRNIPYIVDDIDCNRISDNVSRAIALSEQDWNFLESSAVFSGSPAKVFFNIEGLSASHHDWQINCLAAVAEMKRLEEENNSIFIDAYGLGDELHTEVSESQITLARADREKDCQRLISYVGFDASRYASLPAAASTAARNKLGKEVEKLRKKHVGLLAYDEQLRHHADMGIMLDLDDGVKVNYGKFGNLLAEVKAVTGGASDD